MNQTSEPREERATEANRERTGLKTCRGNRSTEGWGLSDGYRAGEFEFCRGSDRPLTHLSSSADRAHVRYDHAHGTHDLVALVASEEYGYEELVITGATAALRDEVLGAFTVE